jgi:hypothetical protein
LCVLCCQHACSTCALCIASGSSHK